MVEQSVEVALARVETKIEALRADFEVDVLTDFQVATGALNSECDHMFMVVDENGKPIALAGNKHDSSDVKCLKCSTHYDLIHNGKELKEARGRQNAGSNSVATTSG